MPLTMGLLKSSVRAAYHENSADRKANPLCAACGPRVFSIPSSRAVISDRLMSPIWRPASFMDLYTCHSKNLIRSWPDLILLLMASNVPLPSAPPPPPTTHPFPLHYPSPS